MNYGNFKKMLSILLKMDGRLEAIEPTLRGMGLPLLAP